MGEVIYVDGNFYTDRDDAKVSVFDHGYLYGYGVFEGIRVYGGNIFRCKEHIDRLYNSAKYIKMDIPMTPDEMTETSTESVRRLTDAGIPLCNQTVLLRGVNDDPILIEHLMRRLLKERVRPYYLHQGDLTRGTGHFRTHLETGIRIMDHLRGRVSGLAVPTFVVDLPGGGGKVPLLPEYALEKGRNRWVFRNYQRGVFYYPQAPGSEEDEQSRAVNHT